MINQCILVGRITSIEGGHTPIVMLSITRMHENMLGTHEDSIPVHMPANLYEHSKDFLKEGVMVGIKAELQNIKGELTIIPSKLTYLSKGI